MRICDRCGKDCSNAYVLRGQHIWCLECAEYYRQVDKGLGTIWTLPEKCDGCGAKLPYSGTCEYCGRNNRRLKHETV